MRRLTLGVLILGGGTLLALPFRRSAVPDPSSVDGGANQTRSDLMDDNSIEMLVREVTQGVQVPVLYQPQTDYLPAKTVVQSQHLPLTYEDLAVPVERDPIYEERFNAAATIASKASSDENARRIAELKRTFAGTEFVDQTVSRLATGGLPPAAIDKPGQRTLATSRPFGAPDFNSRLPVVGTTEARMVSSEPSGKLTASPRENGSSSRSEHSVLSQLPPPDASADTGRGNRERQWIRQPE